MDEGSRLWALIDDQDDRLPLVTLGEARAVVALLQALAAGGGPDTGLADELAARFARRLPAEE
ncbi:hypothetical protein ABZ442_04970 [Streptomyces triculaminicus]|uniref:hypothetical protein n=1 Tax=Streptomyces triculaminicus TaxID=2816232 RepID=UPI0033E4DEA2